MMRIIRTISVCFLCCVLAVAGPAALFPAAQASAEETPETQDIRDIIDLYWSKGPLIQFADRDCDYEETMLDPYSNEVQFTSCSDFVHDMYLTHYGIELERKAWGIAESQYRYHTISEDEWADASADGRWFYMLKNNVQPGDIISVIYHAGGGGHVIMVYDVTDEDVIIVHGTGSPNPDVTEQYESDVNPAFIEGGLRKHYLSQFFARNYVGNDSVTAVHLIRPLGVADDFEWTDQPEPGRIPIDGAVIKGIDAPVYAGSPRTLDLSLTYNGVPLTLNQDYTIAYLNNIHAGMATIVIVGIGNYTGTVLQHFIIKTKVAEPDVTVSPKSYVYTGKAIKPSVGVKNGSKRIDSANFSFSYHSDHTSVGRHIFRVVLRGDYRGSKLASFTIVPKKTKISSVKAGKRSATVNWKKQAVQTSGYQLQYSIRKNFSSKKTKTITKNTTVSKKITGLKSGKTYYVRVRAYKTVSGTKYYSAWSPLKKVTAK